ncbi:MAG: hypothetical protein WCI84_00165 [Bacteroidota bacterium]
MLTSPVTVNEFVPLRVIVIFAAAAANVNDAQLAATSMVQLAPLAIVAAVADVGTPALQFAGVLQFPVPVKVDCPKALAKIDNDSKTVAINLLNPVGNMWAKNFND